MVRCTFFVHYSETGNVWYRTVASGRGQDLFVAAMLTSQRVHPPREPTYSGEVAAGYLKGCLPFAVGATVTVAIVSLDIVADWIMYKAVLDNNIPSVVKSYTASNKPGDAAENEIVWTLRDVYIRLPGLMQGFLILGSFVFCLYFWWLCFMLVEQRKKFKDKRDGVPRKKKIYERYGGEVLIFLHVLCEDLPVSVILLLAQMSCSCTFFFNFDHVIYLIATCTTAFSLTWKLAQVVWNFGCFNFRDSYLCNHGLVILRIVSLLFISFTWALTAINFVLLRAGKNGELFSHTTFDTSVFDKIGVDRYIYNQEVTFAQSVNFQYITVSNDWGLGNPNEDSDAAHMLTITPVKPIVDAIDNTHTVTLPCENSAKNVTFNRFFKQLHREETNSQRNCSVIFRFHLESFSKEIQYDARYLFYDDDRMDNCVSDRLQIDSGDILDVSSLQDSDEVFTPELPYLNTVVDGDEGSLETSNTIHPGTGQTGITEPEESSAPTGSQAGHTQRNYLSFMSRISANKYKNCKFRLKPNYTLLNEYDVCMHSS